MEMRSRVQQIFGYAVLAAAICCISSVRSQPLRVEWQKKYGSQHDEYGKSIRQTGDGGYLVATSSRDTSFPGSKGLYDILLTKIDKVGNVQWSKMYGGSDDDEIRGTAHTVVQTEDGGFVVAGVTRSDDGDVSGAHDTLWLFMDVWVFKVDSVGNLLWQRSIGGLGDDQAYAIQPTADNGFLVVGNTSSNDGDMSGIHGAPSSLGYYAPDIFVVKMNAAGAIQWQRSYGGVSFDVLSNGLYPMNDGNYLISGRTQSADGDVTGKFAGTDYDNWLIKIDGTGAIIWEKCLGGSISDQDFGFAQKPGDHGFMLATTNASTDSTFAGLSRRYDYCLLRMDSTANVQWIKTYGGSRNEALSKIITTNDGYLLAGGSYSEDGDVGMHHGLPGTMDAWLLRVDDTGKILSNRVFGGEEIDVISNIIETADGGYVCAGFTSSTGGNFISLPSFGGYDTWVMKLAQPDGVGVVQNNSALPEVKLFPTICDEHLQVEFATTPNDVEIVLFDGSGRQVYRSRIVEKRVTIQTKALPSGAYFLKIRSPHGQSMHRIIRP